MTALQQLNKPNSLTLHLKTLTPIYTGGIGQYGEQIHPSGILGNIRHFSCLLAAAIGDSDFETRVWGTNNEEKQNTHAKRIALRIDARHLQETTLPDRVLCQEISLQDDQHKHHGWFYNVAQEGQFTLTLTQRGIEPKDWQLLQLALSIQIRHATMGAKDQFGLGVVEIEKWPQVKSLMENDAKTPLKNLPSLHHAFFAQVRFPCSIPQSLHECLEAGLRWRAHLRGSFRQDNETELRHYIFGDLNNLGNAINVSAVYPVTNHECALRIWGVLPHTKKSDNPKKHQRLINTYEKVIKQREQILTRIKTALQTCPKIPCRAQKIAWQICSPQQNIVTWINKLAGISP